jgi:hypothetical protein
VIPEESHQHSSGVGRRRIFREDYYEGDIVDGLCHGNGTYTWTRGDKYIGQWKNGFQEGNGLLIWKGGNRYEGGWANGLRHGNGTYSWEVKGFNFHEGLSRDRFEGVWVEGYRQGAGKYFWANGNVCEGYWHEDQRTGGHFYEQLTGRHFDAPNVDSDGAEVKLEYVSTKILDAYKERLCTYSTTGKGMRFFFFFVFFQFVRFVLYCMFFWFWFGLLRFFNIPFDR